MNSLWEGDSPMLKRFGLAALAGVVFCSVGSPARALGAYPGGFGGGGWGGWGGSATVLGDEARGMGIFAAGAGQYNLNTAQADAINIDTMMRFNEYLWESQQLANQRYFRKQAERRQLVNERIATTYARLRDNPDRADVHRGDALNVMLDELNAPGVYIRTIIAAQAPLASALVKNVPFRYAPQAISISLNDLTHRVPAVIKEPKFDKERLALEASTAKAKNESETDDQISIETLKSVQAAIKALHDKIKSDIPAGRSRNEADNFLKAAYGLARMMESPEISVFLKELDKVDNTKLASLLGFMYSFNLRFAPAATPPQRNAYDEIFTKLRALRDQVFPQDDAPVVVGTPVHSHPEWATDFFSGMDLNEIQQKKPLTPAKPGGGQ
jgi:hypothetical protein